MGCWDAIAVTESDLMCTSKNHIEAAAVFFRLTPKRKMRNIADVLPLRAQST